MSRRILTESIELKNSTAPGWAVGAVCYQIFPDRFCNGDPENDVKNGEYLYGTELEKPIPIRHADWESPTEPLDVGRFAGGDLQGVLEKLPYLKRLGVEVLYLNPVFESPSNHKYDCSNYELVDPHLTTGDPETSNAWFAEFVKTCHAAGFRVILDGVFNHCSSSHPFFRSAAEKEDSPYRSWFRFDKEGKAEYWWGVKTLPKFNYEGAEELEEYMLGIAGKWVSPPYCCDGWRLDVAADLGHSPEYNHCFWKKFRERVRKANPEALVLAEHYDDPSAWIRGGEWDTVMNYRGFMEPVSFYLTGMEKHSDYCSRELTADPETWAERTASALAELGKPEAVFTAMNQLDNHDHSRMITRTNKKAGKLAADGPDAAAEGTNSGLYRASAVMLYTLPGMAALYYGDETALPGWTDPDSRRTFPWGKENAEMISFFSCLGELRRERAFRYGSLERVSIAGTAPGPVLAYLRSYGRESYLILINPSDRECKALAELEMDGALAERILYTTEYSVSVGRKPARELENGILASRIQAYSAKIYRVSQKRLDKQDASR